MGEFMGDDLRVRVQRSGKAGRRDYDEMLASEIRSANNRGVGRERIGLSTSGGTQWSSSFDRRYWHERRDNVSRETKEDSNG